MVKDRQIPTLTKLSNKPSELDRLVLAFEYNKTLQEIKHDVRLRTI